MASIKLKENHEFDGKKLFQHIVDYLPSYARPRFLRIQVGHLAKFSFLLFKASVS
jgi:hypothetical protein